MHKHMPVSLCGQPGSPGARLLDLVGHQVEHALGPQVRHERAARQRAPRIPPCILHVRGLTFYCISFTVSL